MKFIVPKLHAPCFSSTDDFNQKTCFRKYINHSVPVFCLLFRYSYDHVMLADCSKTFQTLHSGWVHPRFEGQTDSPSHSKSRKIYTKVKPIREDGRSSGFSSDKMRLLVIKKKTKIASPKPLRTLRTRCVSDRMVCVRGPKVDWAGDPRNIESKSPQGFIFGIRHINYRFLT